MRWSGLQDKNNKDVYDGDIIKISETLYYIDWRFMAVTLERLTDEDCEEGDYHDTHLRDIERQFEIVGNIYERN